MALSFKQIEVFRAVITTGSISKAAKLLFVSQPAVSRLLSYTEQRLGFALFERNRGRLYATPEAHALFREIERVYAGIQRVNEVANNLACRPSGEIHVVCGASVGEALVPQAIARFLAAFPDVKVTFRRMTNHDLIKSILDQEAELGLQIGFDDHPNLSYLPIAAARLVCICPPGHPLAGGGPVTPTQLAAYPMITYPVHLPLGQLVENMFATAPVRCRVAVEVVSPQHACSMVEAGAGIALVDEFSAGSRGDTRGHSRFETVALVDAPTVTARVVYLQREPLSRLGSAFVDLLRAVAQDSGRAIV